MLKMTPVKRKKGNLLQVTELHVLPSGTHSKNVNLSNNPTVKDFLSLERKLQ